MKFHWIALCDLITENVKSVDRFVSIISIWNVVSTVEWVISIYHFFFYCDSFSFALLLQMSICFMCPCLTDDIKQCPSSSGITHAHTFSQFNVTDFMVSDRSFCDDVKSISFQSVFACTLYISWHIFKLMSHRQMFGLMLMFLSFSNFTTNISNKSHIVLRLTNGQMQSILQRQKKGPTIINLSVNK